MPTHLVPTLSTKGSTSLHYREGGNVIMTCYSDLPLNSIIWWYNHTDTNLCKFDNSCRYNSPFTSSTSITDGNGTIHQLILAADRAPHGVYSCGIYPVYGSTAVQLQNFTFYGKLCMHIYIYIIYLSNFILCASFRVST